MNNIQGPLPSPQRKKASLRPPAQSADASQSSQRALPENAHGEGSFPSSQPLSDAPPADDEKAGATSAPDLPPTRLGQGPTSTERVARKDALQREQITNALVQLITKRSNVAPFAIGLFGHWGSGKSSQICFVRHALAQVASPRIRFAEFNAWEHESCENMGAALAQQVVNALVDDLSFLQRARLAARIAMQRKRHLSAALAKDRRGMFAALTNITHTAAPLLMPAAIAACVGYLFFSRAGLPVPSELGALGTGAAALWLTTQNFVSKNLTDWFKSINTDAGRSFFTLPDFTSRLGTFHEIHTTLKHLCSLHLAGTDEQPNAGDYLFLIVDDLDRCSAQAVKQVFDAVRLVANINRVVTLVALDERIAFSAVEKHFDQFDGSGRETTQIARDYLGKVFQVAISLPPVSPEASEHFIRSKLFEDHRPAMAPLQAVAPVAPSPVADSIDVLDEEITLFATLARRTGIANPRQLSRLKQAWLLLRGIVLHDGDGIDAMRPWLSTLFCREWLLQQTAQQRATHEAAIRAGQRLAPDATAPNSLYALLDGEQGGWQQRWPSADSVLLPARCVMAPQAAAPGAPSRAPAGRSPRPAAPRPAPPPAPAAS